MDYEDPYESLPPTSTPTTHMLAGSAAGVLEHSVMYPVDCVKVCVTVGNDPRETWGQGQGWVWDVITPTRVLNLVISLSSYVMF